LLELGPLCINIKKAKYNDAAKLNMLSATMLLTSSIFTIDDV
jgi:hypothetical protein